MSQIVAAHPFLEAFFQSDFLGKLIFLALGALSILSWVIIVYKVWATRTLRRLSIHFQSQLMRNASSPLSAEAQEIVSREHIPHPFLRLFLLLKQKTLQILDKNKALSQEGHAFLSQSDVDFVESHLYMMVTSQAKEMRKHLHILFTTYSLAPFLGLLGTVWGILTTFSEMQAHAGTGTQGILGGLSMALATTVFGLIIAIPSLVAYNYLKQSIHDFETEMEGFSSKLLASVEMQYRSL